jgi:enamine deaminase RidA (YjgF/YER057c/UK114 family)
MKFAAAALACALVLPAAASAQDIIRTGKPDAVIADLTYVPAGYDLAFVAGAGPGGGPGAPKIVGTEAQTLATLATIETRLKGQGMSMADVVVMRVFLKPDPDKGGKADRAGMNAAFKTFFGTAAQPNKPARTTITIFDDNPNGTFVEIDAIAAKKPTKKK